MAPAALRAPDSRRTLVTAAPRITSNDAVWYAGKRKLRQQAAGADDAPPHVDGRRREVVRDGHLALTAAGAGLAVQAREPAAAGPHVALRRPIVGE